MYILLFILGFSYGGQNETAVEDKVRLIEKNGYLQIKCSSLIDPAERAEWEDCCALVNNPTKSSKEKEPQGYLNEELEKSKELLEELSQEED
jgi:hypothetical protein